MTVHQVVPPSVIKKVYDYDKARSARARWKSEEDRLKAEILEDLGYDPEDPAAPEPMSAVTDDGLVIFEVTVGRWSGLNFKHFRDNHPDVYAECETSKATLAIKTV